jgi:pimeloyl-ACP methyl ester carboxylesterase
MPKVKTNQIEINYQINGSGHPLLLIAGVGYSSWYWKWIVPELALDLQVITFDNRGAGDSEKPAGPYTVEMMAADTAGLLDSLDIKDVYVMGHSLGGFIAQELVISRPDLVSKLILASTTHGGTKVIPITPEALQVMTNREGDPLDLVMRGIEVACAPGFKEKNPETVKELVEYRFTNPVPPVQYQAQVVAGAGMAAYSDDQVAERMAAIKVPTLVLFGEHDKVVPPGNAELFVDKLDNAKIQIIPGAGHMFPIEAPDATVEVMRQFLLDD